MNIALVVLDTLRKDSFEVHFDWLPGRYYSNAWSTSHWTVPVHGSLFTGKYPSEIGVYAGSQDLDCNEEVLAERFTAEGYTTRAYSCNVNISPFYDFDRGFDQFEMLGNKKLIHWHDPDIFDWSEFIQNHPPEYGRKRYLRAIKECVFSDYSTVSSLLQGINLKFDINKNIGKSSDMGSNSVLKKISRIDFGDREFLFLNLMEAHAPYRIPEEYRDIDDYEQPENPLNTTENIHVGPVKTKYDNAVKYLSDKYREIFNELKKNFEYIITISDHGELLGEHGFYEHAHGLYPELVNVPISIYGPQIDNGKNTQMVSLVDVYQTIFAIANVEAGSKGQNILSEFESSESITEYHGYPYPDRNIKNMKDFGMGEQKIDKYMKTLRGICLPDNYYGYQTVDGFVGKEDCPIGNPEDRLTKFVDRLDKIQITEQTQEISQSVEESLEDLGYI